MDLERRVENLEKLLFGLINNINDLKFYTDADIAGVQHCLSDLTPYKETKVAYYGETEKTFYNVPEGNVSVFFDGYAGNYSVRRIEERLIVSFDELKKETKITISIQ